jgi:hypothetical protein
MITEEKLEHHWCLFADTRMQSTWDDLFSNRTLASRSKIKEPYRCNFQLSAGKSDLELSVYVDLALSRLTGARRRRRTRGNGEDEREEANSVTVGMMGRRCTVTTMGRRRRRPRRRRGGGSGGGVAGRARALGGEATTREPDLEALPGSLHISRFASGSWKIAIPLPITAAGCPGRWAR